MCAYIQLYTYVAVKLSHIIFIIIIIMVSPLSPYRVTQMCDTLKIMGAKRSDTGSYICRVHNDDRDPQAEDTSSALNLEYCSKCHVCIMPQPTCSCYMHTCIYIMYTCIYLYMMCHDDNTVSLPLLHMYSCTYYCGGPDIH